MKKIILATLVLLIILNGSCEKALNKQPISSLSSEKFWRTPSDAPLAMAGIYDALQSVSNNFLIWGDARSDNLKAGGSGVNQHAVALNALTPSLSQSNWASLYLVIARANTAIKYLPRIEGLGAKQLNHYLAQCHALRALSYYYIIRNWGDAPLWTEPYEDLSQPSALPRTPASEIMNKVILPDLLLAETLVDPAAVNLYEVNIGAILAMQTDVYMWNKNYSEALKAANKLIALNRYSLAAKADWKKIFSAPGTTKENIFNIFWDWVKDGGDATTGLIGSGTNDATYQVDNTPGEESIIHLRFQSQREEGDIRAELTYDARKVGNNDRKIGKYIELNQPYPQVIQFAYVGSANGNIRFPVYRYADILLLKAEALNQIGGTENMAAALAIVNQIRSRAGLTTPLVLADYPTTRELETVILDERQTELFVEGKRWFDLVRTGRVIEVMDPVIKVREVRQNQAPHGFTDLRKVLWPISRAALQANPQLVQNEPWSE